MLIACRVCLNSEVKMFSISKLESARFFHSVDIQVLAGDGKPQHVCFECCKILQNCQNFIEKCQRSDELLNKLQTNQYNITIEDLNTVDRKTNNLVSNIKTYGPFPLEIDVSKDTLNCETEFDKNLLKQEENCDITSNNNENIDAENFYEYENNEAKISDKECNYYEVIVNTNIPKIDNNKIDAINEVCKNVLQNIEENNDYNDDTNSEDDQPLAKIVHSSSKKRDLMNKNIVETNTNLVKSIKQTDISNKETIKIIKKKTSNVRKYKNKFKENYAKEIFLSKAEQIKDMNERKESANYQNSPYKCGLCFKGFVDTEAFKNHSSKHDKSNGDFECDLCHMRYTFLRQLRTHVSASHSRKFACKTCPHKSHTANQAREHEKWHKGYLYACKLCGDQFNKPTSHLSHMRKRHPTNFICVLCGEWFVSKHGLVMHNKKTHSNFDLQKSTSNNPDLFCKECNLQFLTKSAWEKHVITFFKHINESSCKICHHKVSNSSELAQHYKEHAKDFKTNKIDDSLKKDEIKFSCDLCERTFKSKNNFKNHVKRVHCGLSYNKKIVCEVCGKKCSSRATLKYHQRTHTGERPFPCIHCSKRFSDNNQLKIHTRIHTDERPYSCQICCKTFRQKPALNRHMRVHTGAKPFKCQYCSKSFSQSSSLKIHISGVHLKLPRNKISKITKNTDILEEKNDVLPNL